MLLKCSDTHKNDMHGCFTHRSLIMHWLSVVIINGLISGPMAIKDYLLK